MARTREFRFSQGSECNTVYVCLHDIPFTVRPHYNIILVWTALVTLRFIDSFHVTRGFPLICFGDLSPQHFGDLSMNSTLKNMSNKQIQMHNFKLTQSFWLFSWAQTGILQWVLDMMFSWDKEIRIDISNHWIVCVSLISNWSYHSCFDSSMIFLCKEV